MVEDGSGKFLLVFVELVGRAIAAAHAGVVVAARTGIHSGNEHKISGVGNFSVRVAESDLFGLKWSAESFDGLAGEFGEFVEEEDAVVGQRYFAREETEFAADQITKS